MTDAITFTDKVTATLQYVDGTETRIAEKARCSTRVYRDALSNLEDDKKDKGLLRALVRERHGSPFESVKMSWMVKAPIFVAREAVRHRIASWNEVSGRYVELEPVFYVPGPDRHLRKVEGSKQMAYATEPGTQFEYEDVHTRVKEAAYGCWNLYQEMLALGILKEVARIVLPLNIMTTWSWEMNVRALTNMLSLRIRHPQSHIESKPQKEIQMLAEQMEQDFATHLPTVHAAWHESGRLPL